jgi:formate dehydrogenase major subunit
LGTSFGRGAATTALWELSRSDCVVVMGSNMAENHPVGFRFLLQARERGATLIHVDPRFTRTSALCDLYAPIRSGSDIAFLGGIIRHILENDLWFRDYVMAFTNIAAIVNPDYADPEQNDGVFSGWDESKASYSVHSWQYEGMEVPSPLSEHHASGSDKPPGRPMSDGPPPSDPTLQHPRCVYQILRRHYARYTPEMVERATGCPRETFLKVCDALVAASGREKTAAFCYAVGWTHSTVGVQIIRAASIVQLLLGNAGRPGGGIMALRGHASIQGSTDIPTLYDMLPTYLPQPNAFRGHHTLAEFLKTEHVETGGWTQFPKYMISLLKAWYGDAALADNEWGYQFLPKLTGDHSQLPSTLQMADGVVKGLFVLGQNPVVGAVNSDLVERGLANLDWMVVRDSFETETANFWMKGRLVRRGELTPAEIGTEVFLMPAALPAEKEGSVTNTNRLVQWHDKVCESPGDSRSELWFMVHLGRKLKTMYAQETGPRAAPINALTWSYTTSGPTQEPDAAEVLREVNGRDLKTGKLVGSYKELRDNGTTSCGGWLYSGIFPAEDHNRARSRKPDAPDGPGTHLGWAFSWPNNVRECYNRASADPEGRPWSEAKKLVWWDADAGKWTGRDVPDFELDKPPAYRPDWSRKPTGMDAIGGADPFIMIPDGRGGLFAPSGLKDGPLPTHYEPPETPVRNVFYGRDANPAFKRWPRPGNELHEVGDPRFPLIFTTYRLTELHCGGVSTRAMPHTAELQPEAFCEISPELARERGVGHLDWVVLSTLRGEIEVRAMITDRIRPFTIDGRTVHQVGMPWVFGWEGYARGDIANVLLGIYGDANVTIHSTKAITCDLRPGRLAR